MINTQDNIVYALTKLSYDKKVHRGFAQAMVSPKSGAGKSFREAVGSGSVRVDTGFTNPERNPFTFSRSHAAPNVPKQQWGKQLFQLQRDAAKSLSQAAIAYRAGDRSLASRKLSNSAATVGRANHTLVDRQAHTVRPTLSTKTAPKGYASPLRKVPNIVPGMGILSSAHEHLKGDAPEKGTLRALKAEAKELFGGKVSSDGHKLDRYLGDSADKKALKQSRRFGSAYKRKAVAMVMSKENVPYSVAKKMVEDVMSSEILPKDVKKGQIRQDVRTAVGEVSHRLKSPKRRMKSLAKVILRKGRG